MRPTKANWSAEWDIKELKGLLSLILCLKLCPQHSLTEDMNLQNIVDPILIVNIIMELPMGTLWWHGIKAIERRLNSCFFFLFVSWQVHLMNKPLTSQLIKKMIQRKNTCKSLQEKVRFLQFDNWNFFVAQKWPIFVFENNSEELVILVQIIPSF